MNKNDLFIVEKTPVLNSNEKEVADLLKEKLSNELSQIDWNYWSNLPFWTPQEAICLLELTDPDRFKKQDSLHSSHKEKLKSS